MIIPAAMFIESAVDRVVDLDPAQEIDQYNELHEAMGDSTLAKLSAASPMSEDFARGYKLGLETMRVLFEMTPDPSHFEGRRLGDRIVAGDISPKFVPVDKAVL